MIIINNSRDYFLVQRWMVDELKLKGNDLLVYALIYSYTKDGTHKFYGSLQYLADWTNSTIAGIQNNLKSLLERGLIFKRKLGDSNSSRCEYWVNVSLQESCNPLQESFKSIQQICNNTNKNNLFIFENINNKEPEILEKNIYYETHKSSKSFKVLKTWIELYVDSTELRNALVSWLEIMYSNRKIGNLECLKNKVDFLLEELADDSQRISAVKDASNKIWFTFQYSVEKLKKQEYNIKGNIPNDRNISNLDLSDEVF